MQKLIFLLLILALNYSCSKDADNISKDEWRLVQYTEGTNSFNLPNQANQYILSFQDKENFSFRLDVNTCGGEVKFKKNNKVEISGGACTEACCDSEFALKAFEILIKSNKYSQSGNELIFKNTTNASSVKFVK
jgi:heat shock protein HslJ